MAKDLLRRRATATSADLSGTVTFEKVVRVGNTECLQVSGSVDCSRYIPSVPSEVKVEKGFLKIGFSEKLPVVVSLPALEVSQSANVGYTMKGRPDPTGDVMTIDVGAALTNLSRVTDVQRARGRRSELTPPAGKEGASMVRRFRPLHGCAALMLGLCGAAVLRAAENVPPPAPAGLVPFTLPWNDVSPGLTNLSGWLEKPAGKSGFIVAKDGHLRAGDRRIRLLGVNLCFEACFPKHEDADQIAPRMARFGINCVRFHHMDTSASPQGLLKDDRRTMDPAQLERLDYLISRLKANGIYADLNLHVGRNFPGLPEAGGISFDKALDHFVPQMIEMQHEYARDLLTHVNPYTGNSYADEPAVALIEISNEDGLIREWLWGNLDALPPFL